MLKSFPNVDNFCKLRYTIMRCKIKNTVKGGKL